MKLYKIEIILQLEDDEAKPRKFIPEALYEVLESGDDILDFNIVEVSE